MLSKYTSSDDSWFIGVDIVEKCSTEGIYYCGTVQKINNGFYLANLEKLIKECPGGSYLITKITQIVPSNGSLVFIEYKYNSQKVLGFLATEWDGSIDPGIPYLSDFSDNYSKFSIWTCVLTCATGRYFNAFNAI